MMNMKTFLAISSFVLFLSSCYYDKEELLYGIEKCDTMNVKYSVQIVNILTANCLSCHGGDASAGAGIRLGTYDEVKAQAVSGTLLNVVAHTPGFTQMPRGAAKLPNCRIEEIRAWISNGTPNN
jgi:hypothetical protein